MLNVAPRVNFPKDPSNPAVPAVAAVVAVAALAAVPTAIALIGSAILNPLN